MLSIGHGNYVKSESVVTIIQPDSAPAKKLRHQAAEQRMLIDATGGRKTRSIIVMKSNHIVLSSIQTRVLGSRLNNLEKHPTLKNT